MATPPPLPCRNDCVMMPDSGARKYISKPLLAKCRLAIAVALCLGVAWTVISHWMDMAGRKRFYEITGIEVPPDAKRLQLVVTGLQDPAVNAHFQMKRGFMCDTNRMERLDPSYAGMAEDDVPEGEYAKWYRQRRLHLSEKGFAWFSRMRQPPVPGTNIWFAVNDPLNPPNTPPWAVIYDDHLNQIWVHCY